MSRISYRPESGTQPPYLPSVLQLPTQAEWEGYTVTQATHSCPSTVAYADNSSCSHCKLGQKHT